MSWSPPDDQAIRRILESVETIAMVGASANWKRPSYFAMKYLQEKGYRVIPVNPKVAATGEEILGEPAYSSLADVPGPFEMVDIFRNSEAAGVIADEAIALAAEKGIEVVWMQLGVIHSDSAKRANKAGLQVVMDRCPKIEFGRLYRELAWQGVNTGVISSRRNPRSGRKSSGRKVS